MDMRKRLPTALILLVLLFLLIQYGSKLLTFLVLQAIIVAALLEFYNLARKKRIHPQSGLGLLLAVFLGVAGFWGFDLPVGLVLFAVLFITGAYYLFTFTRVDHLPYFTQSIAVTLFGVFYLSFTLNYFFLLRFERGVYYIYFLCAVIFLGDTGAYLFGKLIGRHKMTPLASPHKTWEGSAGGILFAVLGAWAARQLFFRGVDLGAALATGALVHAVAQMSDPLESLFKRAVGVKDSSNVLPGHGGFLDRMDSFILAAPFFYYLLRYFWK
jgi:phosphatidate cytidylyltransferase